MITMSETSHALLKSTSSSLGFVAGQTALGRTTSKPWNDYTLRVIFVSIESRPGRPRSSPVGGQSPDILGFGVTKNVAVAVVGQHAEVSFAGGIPAVLDGHNLQGALAQV